jgi:ATP-binding cassette subfamily B protein
MSAARLSAGQPDWPAPAEPSRRGSALLRELIRRRRRFLVLAMLGGVAEVSAMLATPLLVGAGVEQLVAKEPPRAFVPLVVGLVALGILRACGVGARKWHTMRLQSAVSADARDRLYQHSQRLSFAYHDRVSPGDLMARIAGDAWLLQTVVGLLPFMAMSSALGLGAGVLLVWREPVLALAVIGCFAVVARVALAVSKRMRAIGRVTQDRLGVYTGFVEQHVRGIRVVKGHGFAETGRQRGLSLAGDVQASALQFVGLNARFWSTFLAAPALATLMVVGVGGWLGVRGALAPGDVVAFMLYLSLFMAPIAVGAQLGATWPVCSAAAARVAEVLDASPDVVDPPHPRPLPAGRGEIRFEGVTFGHRPGHPVLDRIDLVVAPGTSVALVGLSGAGKTTLTQLIPRFYDPWTGRVLLDGADVAHLRLADLRRAISMVFQDTVVFSTSIRDNIAFAAPDATDADIREAARRAHCTEFIEALPEGYDTVVGQGGASLSGGQRQRLAIARAILSDSRILILDDATSAVDPASDAAVREGLLEVMQGRTTVLVAHRVETLALADRVLLFERGRVVADGTHEELLALPGYRRALALPIVVPA